MTQKFTKKIYTTRLLFNDLGFLVSSTSQIRAAFKDEKIGKVFMEKIMTVVTAVNGCKYCEWFHAKQAVAVGISNEEVKNMLSLQFDADASDTEIIGLLYAQHYAETDRHPSEEMTQKLQQFYGEESAKHIILMIRIIFFGNLSGNTFDAFVSRFKGVKAQKSSFLFEFLFSLLTAPIMIPLLLLSKK